MVRFFISVLVLAFMAETAFAQWAFRVEYRYRPTFRQEHYDRLIEIFQPDDRLKASIDEIHTRYVQNFEVFVKESQAIERKVAADREARLEAFYEENPDTDLTAELQMSLGLDGEHETVKIADRQAELNRRVLDELAALLREHDPDVWDSFERWHRRQFLTPQLGMAPGVGMNLLDILDAMELEELPEETLATIGDLRLSYEIEIDAALRTLHRDAVRYAREKPRRTLATMRMHEAAAAAENYEQAIAIHAAFRRREYQEVWRRDEPVRALRRLQIMFVELFSEALLEEHRAAFLEAVQPKMYPQAYLPMLADRYFPVLFNLDDLTAEQEHELKQLQAEYAAEIERLRNRLIEVYDEYHEARAQARLRVPPRGVELSQELLNLEATREKLSKQTIDRAFHLLTTAQQAKAPKPNPYARRSED
ncbi:MAG TPA: hypothetical protein PK400_05080 [Phycisphaerales bacterium]|nr:hypothetical protein [Phycisphaerales bacterium]